ncbi:hypothetical protein SETIT_1G071400v2 [Setaria italica]|uniref:Knottin scorpion toxin-like domain-containing protein n=2 Tax=Setaria TaxID=4554 RepID=A0A368PIN5_SETIT|nr:hypothetical protein SETIT_1G071400v2 [Setaria italica]TKW37770.1 hypothetical protein SEVIR_1G069900v2 [Setaria viridis]
MARKVTALVASALLLALVFISYDAGVDAWCLEYPAPDINACRGGGRGVQTCGDECRDVGHDFRGGACLDNGDCVCLKCADEPPPAANTQ